MPDRRRERGRRPGRDVQSAAGLYLDLDYWLKG